jgi:pimeloyl-ACP methyl ester carboxylesterase
MGQSDEASEPRSIDRLAADLAALIEAAAIEAPVVLVGHSLGGLIVRRFAERHPAKVAGLVLVDPSSEGQDQRFEAVLPGIEEAFDADMAMVKRCRKLAEAMTLNAGTRSYEICTNPFGLDFPDSLKTLHAEAQRRPAQWRTIEAELEGMTDPQTGPSGATYGDIPLVVLTATDNTIFPQLAPDQKGAAAALWSLMHREVAALSSRGVHRRVANTSHFIQLDQPDAVIEAIDEVVSRVRARP